MKMHWIIQDIFGDETLEFKKALESRGHEVVIANISNKEPILPKQKKIFVRGTRNFMSHVMSTRCILDQENPIGYFPDHFHCSNYYHKCGDLLLNYDHIFVTYDTCVFNSQVIFNAFPDSDTFFIRPNSGEKILTGTRIGKKTWNQELEVIRKLPDTDIDYNTLLLVSSAKTILSEWRFLVIDKKLIGGSQYSDNKEDPYELIGAEFFAIGAIEAIDFHEKSYTMDVCFTPEGYKIVELNSFASAGLYDMDYEQVVKGLEDAYIADAKNKEGFYLKKDDDGHWFLVPEHQVNSFELLLSDMAQDEEEAFEAEDIFNMKFAECRIDGPHCIKILTYEEE